MIVTTTPNIEGRTIEDYKGLVTGEAILGANIFKDLFAGIRDIVGGRSGAYEEELRRAQDIALGELEDRARSMGANACDRCGPRLRDGRSEWQHADGQRKRHGRGAPITAHTRYGSLTTSMRRWVDRSGQPAWPDPESPPRETDR